MQRILMNLKPIWEKTAYRVIIIIAGILLLLFLAVIIFSDLLLNNFVKDNLVSEANSAKNTTLHIDDMSYHLFSNSVEATGIRLSYEDSSGTGRSTYNIIIPSFEISGINWAAVIFGSGLSLGRTFIDRPIIQIKSESGEKQPSTKNNQQKKEQKYAPLFKKSFTSSLPSRINPLNINKLEIRSGKFFRTTKTDDETTKDTISNFNLVVRGISIDSSVSDSSLKYIIADGFSFDAEKISQIFFTGGNILRIDSVFISGDDSLFTVRNFSYKPFLSRQDYFARKKYRADRRIIKITDLKIIGVDFSSLVQKSIFTASSGAINDFQVEILTDKRLPVSPDVAPEMPNEILQNLNFGININKFEFTRGELNVKALLDNSDTAAVLPFSNVYAEIYDLGNLKGGKKYAVIKAQANMFNAAKLSLEVHLDQRSEKLNYTIKGKLDSMSVEKMNQWLRIDELTRLTDGHISKVLFSAEMKDGKAHAIITPVYENLKVELLNKNKEEKKITTFMAKILKLRDKNPKDGNLKTGQVDYIGTKDNTFFDELWIPLKNALGEVVGF